MVRALASRTALVLSRLREPALPGWATALRRDLWSLDAGLAGCHAAPITAGLVPDVDPGRVAATNDRVKTTRGGRVCPRCGSREIATILRGEPAYSNNLEADLETRRVVLGGCVVWDDQPDLGCAACGLEFRADGRPPVLDPQS